MKHAREEDTSSFDFYLPNEVWWLILSRLGGRWCIQIGYGVSKSWAALVSKETLSINPFEFPCLGYLRDALLTRVPRLQVLSIFPPGSNITPTGLTQLSFLTRLKVRSTTINTIELIHGVEKLTKLTRLSCFGNIVMPYISSLRILYFRYNNVIDHTCICQFTNLCSLHLHDCSEVHPDGIRNLVSLEKLHLSCSQIYPDTLIGLTNLTSLVLYLYTRTEICLTTLTKLNTLLLDSDNAYCEADLMGLYGLTHLSICDVNISADLSLFTSLRKLKLLVPMTEVTSLYSLTGLITLKVYGNLRFTKAMISSFSSLKSLSLHSLLLERSIVSKDMSQIKKLSFYDREDFNNLHEMGPCESLSLEPYYE